MRLIDADKLKQHYAWLNNEEKELFDQIVDAQPTVSKMETVEGKGETIRFLLNGCDISFIAEAPKDITLDKLLRQADRIEPDWCACGIKRIGDDYKSCETEIIFDYDDVKKTSDDVSCKILEVET